MIHRGEVVLKIITQKNVNKTALADKLGISRTHLYNHLENADMPTYVISRIGELIGFDFTKVIPEIAQELKEIEEVNNPREIFEEHETLDLNIHLDGKQETLDRLILKLKALNEAIYHLSKH
jgi:plasmid maintenance system antidote protein VapI